MSRSIQLLGGEPGKGREQHACGFNMSTAAKQVCVKYDTNQQQRYECTRI